MPCAVRLPLSFLFLTIFYVTLPYLNFSSPHLTFSTPHLLILPYLTFTFTFTCTFTFTSPRLASLARSHLTLLSPPHITLTSPHLYLTPPHFKDRQGWISGDLKGISRSLGILRNLLVSVDSYPAPQRPTTPRQASFFFCTVGCFG